MGPPHRRLATLLAVFLAAVSRAVIVPAAESCALSTDCLHGFPGTVASLHCANGRCAALNAHGCAAPDECAALTTCVAARCAHGVEGAPCVARSNCGVGLTCSAAGRCTPGVEGVACSSTTAVQCADGFTCTGDVCAPGVYDARCVLDRNCQTGLFCDAGRCNYGARAAVPQFFPWGVAPPPLPSRVPQSSPAVELVPATPHEVQVFASAEPEALSTTVAPVQAVEPPVTIELAPSAEPVPLEGEAVLIQATVEPAVVVAVPTAVPIAAPRVAPTAVPLIGLSGPFTLSVAATAVPIPPEPSPGSAAYSENTGPDVILVINRSAVAAL